jgi:hypothetical protein
MAGELGARLLPYSVIHSAPLYSVLRIKLQLLEGPSIHLPSLPTFTHASSHNTHNTQAFPLIPSCRLVATIVLQLPNSSFIIYSSPLLYHAAIRYRYPAVSLSSLESRLSLPALRAEDSRRQQKIAVFRIQSSGTQSPAPEQCTLLPYTPTPSPPARDRPLHNTQ